LTFVWPSSHHRSGGVRALYEFADGMARRGHDVHFVHGPAWPERIESTDELWHEFEPQVTHHIVDVMSDPSIPPADVIFNPQQPRSMGLPCVIMQGFRMLPLELERETFRAPGPKACVARWLLEVGNDFGLADHQLWHVPMGMDHALFADRTAPADRAYDVALWCNPHPTKGWNVGWSAVLDVKEQRPDLRVLVFSARAPHQQFDLPPGVDLRVGLDQRQLADEVYNQSRIFLQPSFREGFGFTALEAVACGAALVTTDNGGSRDYAIDGETAAVVPIGDRAGLAAGMLRLLDDEEERLRLARNGEQLARTYDWDNGAAVLEGHLLEYLADPEHYLVEPADDADLVLRW
jgi:hypothetical protein